MEGHTTNTTQQTEPESQVEQTVPDNQVGQSESDSQSEQDNKVDFIDQFQKYLSLGLKLATALGFTVLYFYFAFFINFFPSGLEIGDTLVFLFVAIGFGIFYGFWIGIGALFSYAVIFQIYHWKKNNAVIDWHLMLIGSIATTPFFIMFGLGTNDIMSSLAPILGGGVLVSMSEVLGPLPVNPSFVQMKERNIKKWGIVFIGLIAVPLAGKAIMGNFVEASIRILGLSNERASIIVDENNYQIISNVAEELGVPVIGCSTDVQNMNLVHNFRVLWHGSGDRSLVEMLVPSKTPNKWEGIVRIELERDGLKLLDLSYNKESKRKLNLKSCLTMDSDALFGNYEDEPNLVGKKRLDLLKAKLSFYFNESNLTIDAVTVTGYTDIRDVNPKDDDNYKLSERRAMSVYKYIASALGNLSKDKVVIEGMGPLNPKSNCDEQLKGTKQEICLAPDRRVEIVLSLTHSKKKDS